LRREVLSAMSCALDDPTCARWNDRRDEPASSNAPSRSAGGHGRTNAQASVTFLLQTAGRLIALKGLRDEWRGSAP